MPPSPHENKGKIDLIVSQLKSLSSSLDDFKSNFYKIMTDQNKDLLNEIRVQRTQIDKSLEKIESKYSGKIDTLDKRLDEVESKYAKDKGILLALASFISGLIALIIKLFWK